MGQTGIDHGPAHEAVEVFVARVLELTDEQRVAVAAAWAEVDETFRDQALGAAAEALVARSEAYALGRRAVARAHLPDGLEEDPARRDGVARLVRLAIDDMLLALVVQDVLHPKHLRELHRPWQAALG